MAFSQLEVDLLRTAVHHDYSTGRLIAVELFNKLESGQQYFTADEIFNTVALAAINEAKRQAAENKQHGGGVDPFMVLPAIPASEYAHDGPESVTEEGAKANGN